MSALAIASAPAFDFAPQPASLLELFGDTRCRPDVTNAFYHADRSCVSVSGLKQILRSPAHFQAYLAGQARKETPAMFLGTAVHARLLEPDEFARNYVVAPTSDKRTKEYKEFEIANANKLVLTPDQMRILDGIEESVGRHTSAAALLRAGRVEHTLIWQDKDTGIWLKIRPDCLCTDYNSGICLDIKKTTNAGRSAFVRSCVEYDYDLQAAVYLEGLRQLFQRDFDFVFLTVEESPPFGCALYGAPQEMLDRGQRRFREALQTLKACRESNDWPSYQPDGVYDLLEWPRWAY